MCDRRTTSRCSGIRLIQKANSSHEPSLCKEAPHENPRGSFFGSAVLPLQLPAFTCHNRLGRVNCILVHLHLGYFPVFVNQVYGSFVLYLSYSL
jgi:hypothetical protein